MSQVAKFTISLDPRLFAVIEERRGGTSRSAFIASILEGALHEDVDAMRQAKADAEHERWLWKMKAMYGPDVPVS